MRSEIMLAMPIYQLASLCLTVGYKPNYDNENSDMFSYVDSICVTGFDIDDFVSEANGHHIFGLEDNDCFETYAEFAESCPTVAKYLEDWSTHLCPQIINAIYIDELGGAKLVASGLELETTQWQRAEGFFGKR